MIDQIHAQTSDCTMRNIPRLVDQASGLRAEVGHEASPRSGIQVVAVSSGKGGVGKTNVVANLAVACATHGRNVLVMDADLALGNVDILLGLAPPYTIEDVLLGTRTLEEVMVQGPAGIRILPATSGVQELSNLTYEQQLRLQAGFLQLQRPPDLLFIDGAAGLSPNVLYFSLVAHDILVVVSPDPGSLTDAYALVKVLSTQYRQQRFRFLVNMVRTSHEGKEVFRKLSLVTERFLNVSLDYVGSIPFDDHVSMAVSQQRPFIEAYPKAPASRALGSFVQSVNQWRHDLPLKGGYQLFGPAALGHVLEKAG